MSFSVWATVSCIAQPLKQKTTIQQLWVGYINQAQYSKHFGSWFAMHLRTKDHFFNGFSQLMLQGGASYLTGNTRLTAGYSFINYFPADNHPHVNQPEHRPWQMVAWNTNKPKLKIFQSLRLEERFRRKIASETKLGEGYNFNYRAGYNIQFSYPLSKKGFAKNTFFVVANDDLQVNFGKEIVYNYFDQNRVFAGISYMTTASSNVQIGYMNSFQQQSAGTKYRNAHVIRVYYYHTLNFYHPDARKAPPAMPAGQGETAANLF